MRALFDEFKFEVLNAMAIEVVRYFCRAIDDVWEFVDLKKLIVLNRKGDTCMGASEPR